MTTFRDFRMLPHGRNWGVTGYGESSIWVQKVIKCSKAIYVEKEPIDYFIRKDSTVNLGCLDLSKAFNKVNHAGLLLKLMK